MRTAVRPAYIPTVRRVFARLYGAVTVEVDGSPVDLGPPRQRALLALLLGRPGRVVDVDVILEALWGDEPPRTAPHAVQVYVSDLRRAFLEACGRPLVVTQRPGYLLDLSTSEVDAALVEQALSDAASLEASWGRVPRISGVTGCSGFTAVLGTRQRRQ